MSNVDRGDLKIDKMKFRKTLLNLLICLFPALSISGLIVFPDTTTLEDLNNSTKGCRKDTESNETLHKDSEHNFSKQESENKESIHENVSVFEKKSNYLLPPLPETKLAYQPAKSKIQYSKTKKTFLAEIHTIIINQ